MSSSGKDKYPWWKKAVFYEIYPRSFQDTNGNGVGDLKGITQRLDHLNGSKDSLGIDAIWICPFFPSPMKDFGYDITDYKAVDKLFGSLKDLKELLTEAHKRNIKVVIDLVLNHTSDQHSWFKESKSSKKSPKRDWYIWHKGRNGKKPNNWIASIDLRSAWFYDEKTKEFYLSTFSKHQPEVNWRNNELKEAMWDVVRFWLDLGVDGFRLDVVNFYYKDKEFKDNPLSFEPNPRLFQKHKYDRNQPGTHKVCKELRKMVDKYEDKVLIGEVFDARAGQCASFLGKSDDELHMVFNFHFLIRPWKAAGFHDSIAKWYRKLGDTGWATITLSNHDQPRHIGRYKKGKLTELRAKVAAMMMLTLRGTPFLYYGEEIGMMNGTIKKSQLKDPVGIRTWPLKLFGRDPERTPMQWDGTKNAGFSKGTPWLPVNPDHKTRNVKDQLSEKDSILNFYRELLRIRREHDALSVGRIEFLKKGEDDVLLYKRSIGKEVVHIALNFHHRPRIVAKKVKGKVLFSTHRKKGEKVDFSKEELKGLEATMLI